jgi:low affinity Fe/Cu permease
VINTATTIITFLMVFVIQNTQNRDTAAMHIKIDELIRVTQKARNVLLDLEELDDKALELLRQDYKKLARKAKSHTSTPIRAEEVPGKPGKSRARKSKTADE